MGHNLCVCVYELVKCIIVVNAFYRYALHQIIFLPIEWHIRTEICKSFRAVSSWCRTMETHSNDTFIQIERTVTKPFINSSSYVTYDTVLTVNEREISLGGICDS